MIIFLVLKSTLFDVNIAILAFSWLVFSCYVFVHSLSFHLRVYIVSCRYHISCFESCFWKNLVTNCHLIRVCRPFTYNVSFGYKFTILLFPICSLFLFPFPSFLSFLAFRYTFTLCLLVVALKLSQCSFTCIPLYVMC